MNLQQIDYRGLVPEGSPLVKSKISELPDPSSFNGWMGYLTTVDGSNLVGWYLSDGSTWVYQPLGGGSGYFPPPTITGIEYLPLGTDVTKDIIITGTYYTPTTTVTISNGVDSITVNSVTYDSWTQLTVNITTSTVEGGFNVTVDNGTSVTEVDGIVVTSSSTTLIPGDGTTTWDDTSGVTTSLGKILPTSGVVSWGKVGTFEAVPSSTDFNYTFGLEYLSGYNTDGFLMVGITDTASGTGYGNTLFCIYFNSGSQWQIFENGNGVGGATGTFLITDSFRIERVGTVIKYYQTNGASETLMYTSLNSSSTDIKASIDINRRLGVKDNQIVY